jgi:predicted nuclease of predicted toxin-antitoxin system
VKIVVDENIPLRTVEWLVAQGHVVLDARVTPLRSADDAVLWQAAQDNGALLISTDKGFAARWDEPHHGILVVRLRQPNRRKIHERIVMALEEHAAAEWKGLLVVMRDRVKSERRTPAPPERPDSRSE